MPDEARDFAVRLRTRMAQRGLTQADVARGIGATAATVSRYCHGLRKPSFANLKKLARFLGCRVDELTGL